MKTISYLPQLLTVFAISTAAASQVPWGFPLNTHFTAISLNGHDYSAKSPTVTFKIDPRTNALSGSGFAGCNTWIGRIDVEGPRFGVAELGTTKMLCADRMTAETDFLAALKHVTSWRMDGQTLVLEGERTTLLLSQDTAGRR